MDISVRSIPKFTSNMNNFLSSGALAYISILIVLLYLLGRAFMVKKHTAITT